MIDWIGISSGARTCFCHAHRSSGITLGTDSSTLATTYHELSILDIFGFEDFGGHNNSLEQFCINYANEVLADLYTQNMFQRQKQQFMMADVHTVRGVTSLKLPENCLPFLRMAANSLLQMSMWKEWNMWVLKKNLTDGRTPMCLKDDSATAPKEQRSPLNGWPFLEPFYMVHDEKELLQYACTRQTCQVQATPLPPFRRGGVLSDCSLRRLGGL